MGKKSFPRIIASFLLPRSFFSHLSLSKPRPSSSKSIVLFTIQRFTALTIAVVVYQTTTKSSPPPISPPSPLMTSFSKSYGFVFVYILTFDFSSAMAFPTPINRSRSKCSISGTIIFRERLSHLETRAEKVVKYVILSPDRKSRFALRNFAAWSKKNGIGVSSWIANFVEKIDR